MQNTVIIPAWHAAWCLGECLDSIARQTLRPNRIMIGVDACLETAEKALELSRDCPGIEAYHFPVNVGPYRVKNTLALFAGNDDVLHFFDADDLMGPDHLQRMVDGVGEWRYSAANAVRQDGESLSRWTRAHGVVSIRRVDFIMHGGYEPWRCGADTEALQRWGQGGLVTWMPGSPTMIVRKHPGGLTMSSDTGYNSELRRRYRDELHRRAKNPVRRDAIAIADCVRLTGQDTQCNRVAIPMPVDPFAQAVEVARGLSEQGIDTPLHRALDVCVKMLRGKKTTGKEQATIERYRRELLKGV